jgi:diguanylate cyclase (GGDEF)-like protein
LTPEEFQKLRAHPQIGADIVSAVPFPYPVAPLIRSHHERWDGKGFPAGLRGEEIPLGARILSAVDYFDALMADRPYHKALSFEAAIRALEWEAGKGLDPRVVRTCVDVLPQLQERVHHDDGEPGRSLSAAGRAALQTSHAGWEPAQNDVFQDIALAHREITTLYDIAQAFDGSHSISETMSQLASKLPNLVPFDGAALFIFDEATETLHCRFATGIDADIIKQVKVRKGEGLTGWVACNRRPLVNARPSADLEAAGLTQSTSLQSALVCPLMFNDQFVGTLSVYSRESAFYQDSHRRLLDHVSAQVGAALKNATLFEQTQEQAFTDDLTGLPNNRFLFKHLDREISRAERLNHHVSVIVVDVDSFKTMNDDLGHVVADRWLSDIARVLRVGIPPHDVCDRWFSDKFVLVCPNAGLDEAHQLEGSLADHVSRLRGLAGPDDQRRVCVSTGVAIYPDDGADWQELLDAAFGRARAKKRPSPERA